MSKMLKEKWWSPLTLKLQDYSLTWNSTTDAFLRISRKCDLRAKILESSTQLLKILAQSNLNKLFPHDK